MVVLFYFPQAFLKVTAQTAGKIKIFIMTTYLKIQQVCSLFTVIEMFQTSEEGINKASKRALKMTSVIHEKQE